MGYWGEARKGSRWAFCAGSALILIASGCGTSTPPDTRAADETSLRSLDAQWSKTAVAKDVDGTVSYYSEDASLLPPNAPAVTGKAGIRAVWASLLGPDTSLSWQPSKVEVARSGDLAYVMGIYQMTLKDAQGRPTSDHGKFLEVWKKQTDGTWKAVADMFNSDLAAQAPAATSTKQKSRHHHSQKKSHASSHGGKSQ